MSDKATADLLYRASQFVGDSKRACEDRLWHGRTNPDQADRLKAEIRALGAWLSEYRQWNSP